LHHPRLCCGCCLGDDGAAFCCCCEENVDGEPPSFVGGSWPLALQNLLKHSWTASISDRLSMKEVQCLLRSYIECCIMLDNEPDSPTAVCDKSLLSLKGIVTAAQDDEDAETAFLLKELKDHRMSFSILHSDDNMIMSQSSIQSSVFNSSFVGTAASTDLSSCAFDDINLEEDEHEQQGSIIFCSAPITPDDETNF
jgi:hypothetical protein